MQAHISPMKIDDIYITHLHGDHILGLPGMIQSLAFRGRKKPLNIYGPKGIRDLVMHSMKMGFYTISYQIIVHTITEDTEVLYEQDDFLVKAQKMEHNVIDYAYKIEEKRQPKFLKEKAIKLGVKPGPMFGKLQHGESVIVEDVEIKPEEVLGPKRKGISFVYSGDTIPTEQMISFAKEVNVLVHEATFDKKLKDKAVENGHSIAEDVAKLASKAKVDKLVLTHLSNRYTDSKVLLDEAKKIFENTIYATDFMTVVIENKKEVNVIYPSNN